MISSPIDEIKGRLDIVDVVKNYIKLQKAGVNYRAVCPFHSEKKGSFFVSPARQIWHCFGCGKGGDIFGFVKEIEGVDFGDALRILAQKAGVELKRQDPEYAKMRTERQRLYEISELACRFFEKQLQGSVVGKEAKKYLLDRGVIEESIKEWRLGYAPNDWHGLSNFLISQGYKKEEIAKAGLSLKSDKTNDYYDRFRGRIIFPVLNLSSQAIGFGARVFEAHKSANEQTGISVAEDNLEAKYINTPATLLYDKSRVLYGLNKSGVEIRKKDSCILVEGYMDAIMLNQAGFKNVVACSGTALTVHQLNILKRYSENLLTAFDMDVAGDTATKRSIDLAQAMGFNIKVVVMPEVKDPADVIFKNPKGWEKLVEGAKSIHDFYFDNVLARFDKNTLDGKKEILKIILPIIKKIPNKVEKTYWIQTLSRVLAVKEEDISEELQKVKIDQQETSLGQMADKIITPQQKTRKELLEEYFVVLSIKTPNCLNFLEEADFEFFSPHICTIINYLKINVQNAKNEPPAEVKDLVNILFLKAEIEESCINFEEEFKKSLAEIKSLVFKEKMNDIHSAIKKAEEEGKDSQELLKEHGRISKICHGFK